MRLRIGAVLAVAFLAGCGSTHEPTIPRRAIAGLVLQTGDLPAFSQFILGPPARADVRPGPRSARTRFGREGGWISRYRRTGGGTRGPLVVESRADVFDTANGAASDLKAYEEELTTPIPGSGTTIARLHAPSIGDDAVATRLRQGPSVFVTVAWREKNATASVAVQGFARTTHLADAVALGPKQEARLARAVQG